VTAASDYEYRGLMAEAWDLLRGDTSGWGDRAWFKTVVERGVGPALDVGCGTGRLLLDYLAAGLDVDGVDNSPEMLALCREKAAAAGLEVAGRLHLGEMQSLALPRRYATIFVPSTSFLLLPELADAKAALAAFHAHLVPSGQLALSFRTTPMWDGPGPPPPDGEWSVWMVDAKATRPDGAHVRRWWRARFHAAEQLADDVFRYEVIEDGAVTRSEEIGHVPTLRWYGLDEALALVAGAGFTELVATSDSSFEPATQADGRFKIVGKRA